MPLSPLLSDMHAYWYVRMLMSLVSSESMPVPSSHSFTSTMDFSDTDLLQTPDYDFFNDFNDFIEFENSNTFVESNPFISAPDDVFLKTPLPPFDEMLKDERPFKKARLEQTRTIQVRDGVFYDVYVDDTVQQGFYYEDDQT